MLQLAALLLQFRPESTVVFCNTRRDTEEVVGSLAHYGFSSADVVAELARREGLSGIEEKALRKVREREANGG